MAKSVRLGAELEERLRRAARVAGMTESALMREAVARRCDEILKETLLDRLQKLGVIGAIHGGGGQADRSGEAFGEIVRQKYERQLECAREPEAPAKATGTE